MSRHMRNLGSLVLALAASSIACEEPPPLDTLEPSIRVCAQPADVEGERACDVDVLLGERPITVEMSFRVWVVNDGQAPLAVAGIDTQTLEMTFEPATFEVAPGEEQEVTVTLTPDILGDHDDAVTVTSDDPERPSLTLGLSWTGVPKPVPVLELCLRATGECSTDLLVDFGKVRRTQSDSRVIEVKNLGDAPLTIESVDVVDAASVPGEIEVASSTSPGSLPPGASADVIVLYAPEDSVADSFIITFNTDDEAHPTGVVTVMGEADPNLPPVADARAAVSNNTSLEVEVGQTVIIDGTGSSDPEGDPLIYTWSLSAPEGSSASLGDGTDAFVELTPDRAGSYRVELLVTDSLGQQSEVSAVVLIHAIPSTALRVDLRWPTGGDLDLHLVPAGDALFSDADCYFENPRPDLGVAGTDEDDPALVADDETSPGLETVIYPEPPDGEYKVFVHAWAGTGPFAAQVELRFDDASIPAYEGTLTLPTQCALWEVGTVTFPDRTFAVGPAPTSLCP